MNLTPKTGMTAHMLLRMLKDYAKKRNIYFGEVPYDLVSESPQNGFEIYMNGVNVDFENVAFSSKYDVPGAESLKLVEMIGDFPVAWCACGGDWEMPLVFCIYVNSYGRLVGYIPKDGNAFNKDYMCAFGSEPWEKLLDEDEAEKRHKADVELLRAEVKNEMLSSLI